MNIKINIKLILNIFVFHLLISPSFGEISLRNSGIELYLNSITTLKANLIQISSDGEVQTGKLFLKKPGQIRFDYDSPSNHLVIASGLLLVIIDKKSTSEPQRYLTSQTPIGFLLDENISLNIDSNIKRIFSDNSSVNLILYDKKKPKMGELQLTFSKAPMKLKEWTIINHSGERTRVLLENLVLNKPVKTELFNIGQEISNAKKQLNIK